MAESTGKPKKTKAPAKPKATTSADGAVTAAPKKSAIKKTAEKPAPRIPSHEEIAHLARHYWAERGHTDGHAEQDWLRAERELMKQAS